MKDNINIIEEYIPYITIDDSNGYVTISKSKEHNIKDIDILIDKFIEDFGGYKYQGITIYRSRTPFKN